MYNEHFIKTLDLAGKLTGDWISARKAGFRGSDTAAACDTAAVPSPSEIYRILDNAVADSFRENPLFNPYMQIHALDAIVSEFLDGKALCKWTSRYVIPEKEEKPKMGIIAAGNIPAVAFHDYLTILATGCRADIKLSSKDRFLIPALDQIIRLAEKSVTGTDRGYLLPEVNFTDKLAHNGYNAVIATGSDNTVSLFREIYGNTPILTRGSRFSTAVIKGNENFRELESVAKDALLYYGLGCRSVSHLIVPEGYDFTEMAAAFVSKAAEMDSACPGCLERFSSATKHMRALKGMCGEKFTALGPVTAIEEKNADKASAAPFAAIIYETYGKDRREDFLAEYVSKNSDSIQKIYTTFGNAQQPDINDYADGVDTVQFILNL